MQIRALHSLVAAATLVATLPGSAADAATATCVLPSARGPALADRAGMLALYERLPQSCLQDIFGSCAAAADRGLLGLDSAVVCSLAYEALLQQRFGGDFQSLLAWWRSQGATGLR